MSSGEFRRRGQNFFGCLAQSWVEPFASAFLPCRSMHVLLLCTLLSAVEPNRPCTAQRQAARARLETLGVLLLPLQGREEQLRLNAERFCDQH